MPPANVVPLEPAEVRVYYAPSASVEDSAEHARCLARLSDEERERHRRFHFERDRHSYLAAHALTRSVLGELVACAPEQLRFAAGPHGRPELCEPEPEPRLRFNLSHTHGMVACGVALEHDIGVDVEYVERRLE